MKKMYIFVRSDLQQVYSMVQGAHALAEYAIDHYELFKEWSNSTIVFVQVENEMKMMDAIMKMDKNKIVFSSFSEPDLGYEVTSVCCYCEEFLLKSYQLA